MDLVLQSESVKRKFYEANSMVKVNNTVSCLGIQNGGLNPRTVVVLGGHQLENYILEFDLVSSKLGFNSSLLQMNTSRSHSSKRGKILEAKSRGSTVINTTHRPTAQSTAALTGAKPSRAPVEWAATCPNVPVAPTTHVTFIGGGPYIMRPVLQDLSKLLTTTPLLINPVSTAPAYTEGEPSDEYFIGVKFIRVDGKLVSFNNSLLTIDKNGNGGTKLSTIVPYTVLHNSIYKAFASAFVKAAAAKNMKRVALVRPFGVCFSATANGSVPYVDLVLQSESVKWRFYEANSMVKVNKDVMCLGIKEWRTEPKNRSGFRWASIGELRFGV
ncbi:hypothetical protein LguiA_030809 [Lonicera macranthoides]